jgi:hypothetical protein
MGSAAMKPRTIFTTASARELKQRRAELARKGNNRCPPPTAPSNATSAAAAFHPTTASATITGEITRPPDAATTAASNCVMTSITGVDGRPTGVRGALILQQQGRTSPAE